MREILPPRYFTVLLLLLVACHFLFPVLRLIQKPYNYLGTILILFGIILNLWADQIFKRKKTTVKPNEMPSILEVSGPFKISRHPMYLGMAAILLGTSLLTGNLVTIIFPIAFIIIMHLKFIPMEEKNLIKKFGDNYSGYKRKTRKWM